MSLTTDSPLYFEAHVTIEPVYEERLAKFTELCKERKFHVATLVMQKRKEDTPERSKFDSFCTGHGKDGEELKSRMFALLDELKAEGYQIWRYKIEVVPLDSRYDDSPYRLDKTNASEKERNPRAIV